ncbi:ImmA/IrrE family metallo-endopeptidase [Gulosibacter faecalis]|uniref:ImmA/IrrE family metallo-endopeptidase n=1 Tax=Gulosibacter faecalis TaxID=272240 RepID=A0ABW5UTU5_9MICO|nr:ImmA/IrrE family metallo-endopeptidase [Gulosibacter faecalis]
MWDPLEHADLHRIRVRWRHQDEAGRWYRDRRLITLRHGLTPIQERCTLAHELGHAFHQHSHSDEHTELQADRWAAGQLITVDTVVDCALVYPDHPERWCTELEVTPHMLRTWFSNPTNSRRAEQLWRATA